MSNYQTKDFTGVLFKNENKATDKHPEYTGSATINGVDHFLDVWVNVAESGRRYMSLKFKVKDKQAAAPAPRPAPRTHGDRPNGPKNRPAPSTGFDDMSDDVPF